jgi:hypothetical protein
MTEQNKSWTLIGSVIRRLGGKSNLSLGDRLLIKNEVEKFQQEFTSPPSDTREGPDYQEGDVVVTRLKDFGFDTKQADKNREELVTNYSYEEDRTGNQKAGKKLRSALLNKGREIEGD